MSERPKLSMARQVRLAIGILLVIGLSVLLLVLYRSYAPVGTLSGTFEGEVERVALVDVKRAVYRDGVVDDGTYRLAIPSAAQEPMIVLYGKGGSMIEVPVTLEEGETHVEVPHLKLWRTELSIKHTRRSVRFDWAPIPTTGEGYPTQARYSLLFKYQSRTGDQTETSLLAFDPPHELTLRELQELLKEWDSEQREVVIELRAFDSRDKTGPLWVGITRTWDIPE